VAQVVSFFFPLKSDSRMTVAITGLVAVITFNFVLVQLSPPVSYMTKMTLISMWAILICLLNLVIQTFFRSVFYAAELLRKEAKAKKATAATQSSPAATVAQSALTFAVTCPSSLLPECLNQELESRRTSALSRVPVFCGLLQVTLENRIIWLERLCLWNEVVRIGFFLLVVVVMLPTILA
jgi:hypothetical protein